jgi:hypothetical protein
MGMGMDERDAMLHALGMQEAMNVMLEAMLSATSPECASAIERTVRERADIIAAQSEYFAAPTMALAREAERIMLRRLLREPGKPEGSHRP